MAFARFGRDSDVYVYADTDGGYTCERCPKAGESYHCRTAQEMVTHLTELHRGRGDRVPDDAIAALERDEKSRS